MADHEHRDIGRLQSSQLLGQPVHRLNVEMVGGFVENQQVMIGQQQCHQRDSATLTAAQVDDLCIEVDIGQQVLNGRSRSRVGGPYVVRLAAADQIAYRCIGPDLVSLMQEADRKVTGVGNPARVRDQQPCKNTEQGGLPGSVVAHDSNRLTATETQTDAVEQRTSPVGHRDAFCVDQVAHHRSGTTHAMRLAPK